jgi:peptide/nickel transport system substrate-binding protein
MMRNVVVATTLVFLAMNMCIMTLPCFLINAKTVPNPAEMIVTGNEPWTLDPARASRATSEIPLILNVYEKLIFFDREKISSFVPMLATEVPSVENGLISADGLTYTFPIRTGVKFHNGETLTTEDVEYSFERILVHDIAAWMLYEPLLGRASSRDEEGNIVVTAEQIGDAITCNDTHIMFHLNRVKPYPPFLQTLSQWFSSILSKDWCIAHGDWPGTWENWQDYNQLPESPIDLQDTEPPGPHTNAMCGTGPYMLDYWNHGVELSIIKFDDYWGGWPAPSCRGFVERATTKFAYDWETRKNMFLAGDLDNIHVPETNVHEVLGQSGTRCIYPLSQFSCTPMCFTFNISESSLHMGVLSGLPPSTLDESGIPPDFFSDISVRKGFARSINYTKLIDEAFLGNAYQPATPVVAGLPFYNSEQEKYSLNLTRAEQYFQNAWDGELWSEGFTMTLCHPTGHLDIQMVCEMIKTNVERLNPKFHINIQDLDYSSEYLPQMFAREIPLFFIGWVIDFFDPHDFVFPFMHSRGDIAVFQGYSNSTVDTLVEVGINETDMDERQDIYYELQSLYHEDCPGVPLYQPRVRHFERDWVQGWYYNPLLWLMNYFYTQWKESIPQVEVTPGSNTVDAVEYSDAKLFINTTASGVMSISKHYINMRGTVPEDVTNVKWVVVDTSLDSSEIVFPVEICIYYTNEEILPSDVNRSTLRMYFWNETRQEWTLEQHSECVTPADIPEYDGFLTTKIYHLGLFALVTELWLETDLNKDGTVNIVDISIVAVAFGTKPGDENWNETADMDGNKEINIVDVSIVAMDYGKTV